MGGPVMGGAPFDILDAHEPEGEHAEEAGDGEEPYHDVAHREGGDGPETERDHQYGEGEHDLHWGKLFFCLLT